MQSILYLAMLNQYCKTNNFENPYNEFWNNLKSFICCFKKILKI